LHLSLSHFTRFFIIIVFSKPYPPKNYEKAAKSIHDNKCTVNDIKEKFFLSLAAEATIKEMVLKLEDSGLVDHGMTKEEYEQ